MSPLDNSYLSVGIAKEKQASSFYGNNLNANNLKDPAEVGGSLEAMFYRLILKNMRESTLDEDPLLDGGFQSEQYREMQHNELAEMLGREGKLGIRDLAIQAIEQQRTGKMNLEKMIDAQRIEANTDER